QANLKSKSLFFLLHVTIHAHHKVEMPYSAELAVHLEPHYPVNVIIIVKPFKHSFAVFLKVEFPAALAKYIEKYVAADKRRDDTRRALERRTQSTHQLQLHFRRKTAPSALGGPA